MRRGNSALDLNDWIVADGFWQVSTAVFWGFPSFNSTVCKIMLSLAFVCLLSRCFSLVIVKVSGFFFSVSPLWIKVCERLLMYTLCTDVSGVVVLQPLHGQESS